MFDIFTQEGIISFLYVIPALLIGLSVHEFAHAFVAYKLGDKSQKSMGRLTLDPFAHIDWLGFLSIALFKFGWAKPVYVNDSNFKNRNRDNMLVALSGPLSNLVLAIITMFIVKILLVTGVGLNEISLNILMAIVSLNVLLCVLNLLPLPPFDGSKVLLYFIPYKYKDIMYKLEAYSLYIIIILLVTNVGSMIISPIANKIMALLLLII